MLNGNVLVLICTLVSCEFGYCKSQSDQLAFPY